MKKFGALSALALTAAAVNAVFGMTDEQQQQAKRDAERDAEDRRARERYYEEVEQRGKYGGAPAPFSPHLDKVPRQARRLAERKALKAERKHIERQRLKAR